MIEKEIKIKKGEVSSKLHLIAKLMKGVEGLFETVKIENPDSFQVVFGADTQTVAKQDFTVKLSIKISPVEQDLTKNG